MKLFLIALLICMSSMVAAPAFADTADAEWIAECIQDNKNANVSIDVITRYCTCMNNKMSSSETLSVTEWEKTHPRERAECDREAGWN